MQPLLVTGGCGFIGSNYVRYLLESDPELLVVNIDCLTYAGNLGNLADLANHPRYRFVKGDITDREAVREAIGSASAASSISPPKATSIAASRTPARSSAPTCSARRCCSTPPASSVFQEVCAGLDRRGLRQPRAHRLTSREETPLHPNSPYSASKAGADLLVQAYQHTFGLPAVITRCSNNYGPYQFPEKTHSALHYPNLMQDEPVPVYGDGQQIRDWIHVSITAPGRGRPPGGMGSRGEVYNFGGGCEKANLDLTHAAARSSWASPRR